MDMSNFKHQALKSQYWGPWALVAQRKADPVCPLRVPGLLFCVLQEQLLLLSKSNFSSSGLSALLTYEA